jgi:protein-S-isoprenylcysteine O-methyltransferase Ste14
MDRTLYLRALALYLPLVLALLAGFARKQPPRQFAACLLSLLWALPSLLALQTLNQLTHWWTFAPTHPQFRAMPLELYLGWTVLWGILPQLAFPRLKLLYCAPIMIAIDLLAMPRCAPLIVLGPHWLLGEAVAVVVVLIPALCIARWTLNNTHLPLRATIQVAISALIFLYLLPEVVFALRPGAGWQPLLQIPSWQRQLWLQIVFLCAIPGVSAVMEFAQRGCGTPIPYDPPQQLVTTGIYRYVANPMQLSCAIVMLLWAAMLRNGWLLLAAVISIIYSAGIAEWDEASDLSERFGRPWRDYRGAVRNWRPRWLPYHAGPPAKLYVAATCGPCSEVRRWFEARHPIGLEIIDAETLPAGSIRRIRYEPAHPEQAGAGAVEGIRAVARALEHLNLVYAIAGAALRLPLVWQFVQLVMDASGLGPRDIPSTCEGVIRPS